MIFLWILFKYFLILIFSCFGSWFDFLFGRLFEKDLCVFLEALILFFEKISFLSSFSLFFHLGEWCCLENFLCMFFFFRFLSFLFV